MPDNTGDPGFPAAALTGLLQGGTIPAADRLPMVIAALSALVDEMSAMDERLEALEETDA